jgi:hypothetical protein
MDIMKKTMNRDKPMVITPSQAEALEEAMGLEPNTIGQPMKSKSTLNKENILRIHKKVKGMIRVGWNVKPDTIVTTVDMIGKDGNVTSTENVTYRQLKKLVKTL